jgi:hypothetical protein
MPAACGAGIWDVPALLSADGKFVAESHGVTHGIYRERSGLNVQGWLDD